MRTKHGILLIPRVDRLAGEKDNNFVNEDAT